MNTKLNLHKTNLNRMAELGWNETKTTEYIYRNVPLKPFKKGFGKKQTGLLYKIGKGKDSILLRTDIDALLTKNGPRHICGHSSHTAGLLQTLIDITKEKRYIADKNRSIYFLFQPAEETYPSGAKAFMEECQKLTKHVRFAFAAHVRPLMKAGVIGVQSGPIMARGDYFEITVQGKMSHVKNPEKGADAIEAASRIVLACRKYQKENLSRIRLNVGVIQGGRQSNAIADSCILKGDIRLDDDKLQKTVQKKLRQIIASAEKATNTKIALDYFDGYPVLANDEKLAKRIGSLLNKHQRKQANKSMFSFGCEDFSFIANSIPSLYAFIGTGDKFDIHDDNCTISDAGTDTIYRYFTLLVHWWFSL